MEIAISVNGVPIRLTEERWRHILNARDDLSDYYDECVQVVAKPDMVLTGSRGTLKSGLRATDARVI